MIVVVACALALSFSPVPHPRSFFLFFFSKAFTFTKEPQANPVTFPTPQMKQAFDPLCLLNCDKIVRIQQPKPGEVAEW